MTILKGGFLTRRLDHPDSVLVLLVSAQTNTHHHQLFVIELGGGVSPPPPVPPHPILSALSLPVAQGVNAHLACAMDSE